MSHILHVCGYFDPSGDVTRSVRELNKHSKHTHEVIIHWKHPNTYLQFDEPEQGQCPDAVGVKDAFDRADAVIHHLIGWNSSFGYNIKTKKPTAFRNANVMYDRALEKFYCLQPFFANPMDEAYKLTASCHMAAREFMGRDCRFLPALMPIWDELYMPDWNHRKPCVAYSKHSEDLVNVFNSWLRTVDASHRIALNLRKYTATIVIDNVGEGHYGLAGTESLSQGIPAIAWNHPITLEQLNHIAPGVGTPFFEVKDLMGAVRTARENAAFVEDIRHIARNWIVKFYDSGILIERYWDPFCDELIS